jgi:hypothetical protein
MPRWQPLLALAAAAAVLSGCGTQRVTAGSPALVPITSMASYRTLTLPPNRVRLAAATRKAHALINTAKVPHGGVLTSASIAPSTSSGYSDVVDIVRTYAVAALPANPAVALLPPGGSATGSSWGNTGWSSVSFSFDNQNLGLEYTMQQVTHGYLVRIDATVAWKSTKPLVDYVAEGSSRITVAFTSSPFEGVPSVVTGVVTKVSAIDSATILVDAMQGPADVYGVACPVDSGGALTLSFWHAHAAHAFAVVSVDRSGCGWATINHYDARGALTASGLADGLLPGAIAAIAHLAGISRVPPAA